MRFNHYKPVLVEDVSLTFTAMGRLPGTFIKWFLEEVGLDGLSKLAHQLEHPGAEAAILYYLYDGNEMHYFEARQKGTIAKSPSGTNGFGWDPLFIPEEASLTHGDMDEETFRQWDVRARAIENLKTYLNS